VVANTTKRMKSLKVTYIVLLAVGGVRSSRGLLENAGRFPADLRSLRNALPFDARRPVSEDLYLCLLEMR
jgi:hypothetical protein